MSPPALRRDVADREYRMGPDGDDVHSMRADVRDGEGGGVNQDPSGLFANAQLEWVKTDRIFVPEGFQRPAKRKWISARAREGFDPRQCGPLSVYRDGERYAVMDGQQRSLLAAASKVEYLPCLVWPKTEISTAASSFLGLNDVTAVIDRERFRAMLVEGDPTAVGIDRVIRRHGWYVKGTTPRAERAVQTSRPMRIIWEAGGEALLDAVVSIAIRTWGTEPIAAERHTLLALARVLQMHPTIDHARLILALKPESKLDLVRMAKAKAHSPASSVRFHLVLYEVFLDLYNRKGRAGRLHVVREEAA